MGRGRKDGGGIKARLGNSIKSSRGATYGSPPRATVEEPLSVLVFSAVAASGVLGGSLIPLITRSAFSDRRLLRSFGCCTAPVLLRNLRGCVCVRARHLSK